LLRKFWRENLPRLKFWNPAIPMIVNRKPEVGGPATMTLYFRPDGATTSSIGIDPVSSLDGTSKAPEPSPSERVVTIDMKARHSTNILEEFMEKTGATPVVPSSQEEGQIARVEEMARQGEFDRQRVRRLLNEKKREAALLDQAKREAAAVKGE
jgi:large subunit ribosomal protein MRP49